MSRAASASPPLSGAQRPAQQRVAAPAGREAGNWSIGSSEANTAGRRPNVFLGNSTKLPSPPVLTEREAKRRKLKRKQRFRLRDGLFRITTIGRVGSCGGGVISKSEAPTIRIQGDGASRVAHFTGVRLCGAVHTCPVCSPRIRQHRAEDIDTCAHRWISQHGTGSVMLGTFTMPHDLEDGLAETLTVVRDSFGAMISGEQWQDDKDVYGVRFYIVSHDCTVGDRGWHPHLHVLFFGERALSDAEVAAFEQRLYARWTRAVTARGYRPPSRAHGVKIERARRRRDVARYVAQVVAGDDNDDKRTKPVALEMARGDLKSSRIRGHRSPWQLLSDIVDRRAKRGEWTDADDAADDRDVALWREWEKSTKGLPAIRWARGLRAAVGMQKAKSDAEVVNEVIGGVDVYAFACRDDWRAVRETPGARSRVLHAAERGGPPAVRIVVRGFVDDWERRRKAKLQREERARLRRELEAISDFFENVAGSG